MAKTSVDTTYTPQFQKVAYDIAQHVYHKNLMEKKNIILAGLFEYQQLNPNALNENKIRVINNKYYDKYTNGVWQNPYETRKTFALTPPILHNRSKDVYFKLPNELFLTNLGSQISTIQLDADNGQGYQNLPF